MPAESVTFTQQLMTVIVEHERLIDKTLKRNCGLTTTEYCILRSVYLSKGEVAGIEFASFLQLRPNSISVALEKLENKGFVVRASDENDRRCMKTSITRRGKAIVKQATGDVFEILTKTFWRDFTSDEVLRAVSVSYPISNQLNPSRCEKASLGISDCMPVFPEFVATIRYIVQRWTSEIRKVENLSLSEFRILALINNSIDAIHVSDIARQLFLVQSSVSIFKARLEDQGYVVSRQGTSKRSIELSCTPKGEAVAIAATARLAKVTAELYAPLDEETSRYLNEWHMRMYRDLMTSALTYRS